MTFFDRNGGFSMKKVLITAILLAAMLFTPCFGALRPVAMADDAQETETGAAALTPEQEAEAKAALEEGLSCWFARDGKEFDRQKAVAAFRKAAALGLGDAYAWLGELESNSLNAGRWARAMKYYQKGAELGSGAALYRQGDLYRLGCGVTQDTDRARILYEKALESGSLLGWAGLGRLKSGSDGAEAAACFEKLLDSDDWTIRNAGRCLLASLYRDGAEGLEADIAKSLAYYREAADEGYVDGYYGLGNLYYYGEDLEQDKAKAFELFSEAAEHGSFYDLAFLYWEGFGVEQDYARAAELFEKDVEAGRNAVVSAFMLGLMSANGQGTEADESAAADWCRRALAGSEGDEGDVEQFCDLMDALGVEHPEAGRFCGTWRLNFVENGETLMTPDEAMVRGMLLLYADGTGMFVINGSESAFPKWEETDGFVVITGPNGSELDCSVGDEGLAVPYGDDYTLVFGLADGRADSSLLYPVYRSIDTEAGARLRYSFHTGFMDATSVLDVHARGGSYYALRTTSSGKLSSTSATCLLDGKAYNLDPDKKTGTLVTETSLGALLKNALMMDTLYQKIVQRAHDYDYTLEIREVDGAFYAVEVYPATDYAAGCAFYYDTEGRLAHVLEDAPAVKPDMGETFYTVESVDGAPDETLFDLSGYTIE